MISHKEIQAHDLRVISFHEAGHVAVAHQLGYLGVHFRVWPCATEDAMKETTWAGKTYLHGVPEGGQDFRLICLGGVVAEAMMEDPDNPYQSGEAVQELIEFGVLSLSATDAEGAKGYTEADLEKVGELLLVSWGWVRQEVEYRQAHLEDEV